MTVQPKLLLLLSFLNLGITFSSLAQAPKDPQQEVSFDEKYAGEIERLAQRPEVKRAMEAIEELEPQTKRDHITLTEIPAPPFGEGTRGKAFAEMLRAAGLDSVWVDEVGNVIGRRKGTTGEKTVMIEAHLDTVFPEETDVIVKERGDTLFAPGIVDDTRGLAVVLAIAKAVEQANVQTDGDILFVGTVGEEGPGDLRGVKHLFSEKGQKIDSYIAIESGGPDRITYRGIGSHRYRVTFKGPGGHSFGAFGLVNPHNALGRAIHYFTVDADEFTKDGVRATYNVGLIGGGTSINSIPFESWMEVDMRSESPERVKGIDELFQAAVQKALKEENEMKRRGADLTVEVDMIGDRPAGSIDPESSIVQRAMATSKYLDAEPNFVVGSTNSNIPFSMDIPAVTIGSGGKSGGAHSLDEWWLPDDQAVAAIQRALLLLLAEAGVAD
jgi:tripeptide aminopeptidase